MGQQVAPSSPTAMIRSLHDGRGLSLAEIGAKLGVTRTAVWNWYTGKSEPRSSTRIKIAQLLETPEDHVISATQKPFQQLLSDAKAMIAEGLEVPADAVTITIKH